MTCVLRIFTNGAPTGALVPYRFEDGTAHFEVSNADFADFRTQVKDAISFLRLNATHLQDALSQPDASGVLDFAVEDRDVAVQCDTFPADLVRTAGSLGLALEISRYPQSSGQNAEA